MSITLISQEQLDAAQAEMRPDEPEVERVNTGPAVEVLSTGLLRFAGVVYTVPPVPFREGVRLLGLMDRLRRVTGTDDEARADLGAILAEAVSLFPRLVRPLGWRRFMWRLLPNPFGRASEGEIGHLLGFFFGCRTRSRVGHP